VIFSDRCVHFRISEVMNEKELYDDACI